MHECICVDIRTLTDSQKCWNLCLIERDVHIIIIGRRAQTCFLVHMKFEIDV